MDMSVKLRPATVRHDPGTRVPVYRLLAEDLARLGAPVFGLMSDDTMLLAATLDALGSGFHGARHENSAVAMAEGWASATGELGVALIGRGPAAANALHGAVFALKAAGNVVHAEDTQVVLYGVQDLVVVARHGLTMVTTREQAADLKTLLDALPSNVRGA